MKFCNFRAGAAGSMFAFMLASMCSSAVLAMAPNDFDHMNADRDDVAQPGEFQGFDGIAKKVNVCK